MERHGVRSDDDETVYVWAPAVPPPPVAFHAVVVNIKEEVGGSTSSNEGHDDATRSNEGHEQVHVHISGRQPPSLPRVSTVAAQCSTLSHTHHEISRDLTQPSATATHLRVHH